MELEKSLHCARSILVNFQKDEYIYRQEDEPKRLYFVLEGKVELGRAHQSGRLLRTEQVKEGDAFGAIEVFLGEQAHSCYAKAKTQVQVLAVGTLFFRWTLREELLASCAGHKKYVAGFCRTGKRK